MAGLGKMGSPMASRLIDAGVDLLLWNRDRRRLDPFSRRSVRIAESSEAFCQGSDVILLMLANDEATDEVLQIEGGRSALDLSAKLVVNMGTGAPERSLARQAVVATAGGTYIEAPVSGSRLPAEQGQLVAMVAGGRKNDRKLVRTLLAPMCRKSFDAGAIPGALNLKLAVNLFLITTVAGLAEAFHLGERLGINPALLRDVIAAGPMSSPVSSGKAGKIVDGDFAAQAAIRDVHMNCRLVASAARAVEASTPLLDKSLSLFADRERRGDGALDMASVIRSFEATAAVEPVSCVGRQFDAYNRRDLARFPRLLVRRCRLSNRLMGACWRRASRPSRSTIAGAFRTNGYRRS